MKIAAARQLNVSRKEKNRLNAELALQTEGLEELQLDILTMENINEGEFPVVSSDSNFLEETELKLRDLAKEILANTKERIHIPDLIAVSNKTFNLPYDENLSSYEIIAELCNSLDSVKAEYFTAGTDRIV